MCREEAQKPRSIENLSKIYRLDRKMLDGSRSYQDKVQKSRWIENAIRFVEKRSLRGSIDRNLSRSCRVRKKKKQFFKERKNTKRWMQTSKLLKYRSNQHISKTSLNKKKKCKTFINPKYTHTLNNSKQYNISKTI